MDPLSEILWQQCVIQTIPGDEFECKYIIEGANVDWICFPIEYWDWNLIMTESLKHPLCVSGGWGGGGVNHLTSK